MKLGLQNLRTRLVDAFMDMAQPEEPGAFAEDHVPKTMGDVLDLLTPFEPPLTIVGRDPDIVDIEDEAARVAYSRGKSKGVEKRQRYAPRQVKDCKAIVLHQTGVKRSPEVTRRRARHYTCHILIGPEGVIYRVHPFRYRLIAAHRFDRRPYHAINIEIDGNFRGTPTGDWWAGDKMGRSRLPVCQTEAAIAAIDMIVAEVAEAGGRIEYLFAHRQSSASRQIDPGFEIWRHVAEVAKRAHGLSDEGGRALGGMPIPPEWKVQ